jgi:hypothetical protein
MASKVLHRSCSRRRPISCPCPCVFSFSCPCGDDRHHHHRRMLHRSRSLPAPRARGLRVLGPRVRWLPGPRVRACACSLHRHRTEDAATASPVRSTAIGRAGRVRRAGRLRPSRRACPVGRPRRAVPADRPCLVDPACRADLPIPDVRDGLAVRAAPARRADLAAPVVPAGWRCRLPIAAPMDWKSVLSRRLTAAAIERGVPLDLINNQISGKSRYECLSASHMTGRLSKPRNAQPPIRTGSLWSSRNPFNRLKMPGNATSATIAREANAPAQ